jgi:predicted RNA-binding Zn-ribbon protein involved in translation (DUF1610 family)
MVLEVPMFRLPNEARVTRVTAPHDIIRTFDHRCRQCGWEGPGAELITSEVFEESGIVEYTCPRCHEDIAFSGPR